MAAGLEESFGGGGYTALQRAALVAARLGPCLVGARRPRVGLRAARQRRHAELARLAAPQLPRATTSWPTRCCGSSTCRCRRSTSPTSAPPRSPRAASRPRRPELRQEGLPTSEAPLRRLRLRHHLALQRFRILSTLRRARLRGRVCLDFLARLAAGKSLCTGHVDFSPETYPWPSLTGRARTEVNRFRPDARALTSPFARDVIPAVT